MENDFSAIDGYCTIGVDREYDMTAESLLEAMDRAEVGRAMTAPPDRFLSVYNREGNETMRDAFKAHKDRFIPTCTANPWYGKPAVDELRRALGDGARMLIFHPWVQGFAANDELVFPLLEEAAAQKIPVYIHTGPPGSATPWQVIDLAEQFPSVDLIMGHSGATDFWNDVPHAGKACENVYLESSMARPFLFARYVDAVGIHKGIVGSWSPLNDLNFEWTQMRKFVRPEVFAEISGKNLLRLLEKRGAL